MPTVEESSAGALRVIAEGVSAVAGFGVVVIAAVHDAEQLGVVAVAAPADIRTDLLGVQIARGSLLADLAAAETWGRLPFLPAPSSQPHASQPESPPEPPVWLRGDRMLVPMRSSTGRLLGVMWVDEPVSGRRPDPAVCELLEAAAQQAGQTITLVAGRQDLGEQMRLVTASREVVRRASRELEIAALVEQIRGPLVVGFQALGMWSHLIDADGGDQTTLYDETGHLPALAPELAALAQRIAEDAWREQRVGIVSKSRLRGRLMSPQDVARLRGFLDEAGVGSLLFIPVGTGPQCLGSLILARALDDSVWSEGEIEVALDLGHDLGRAVLNARIFERERELVRRLQALDAHKTTLITTMSHELKSPLTAILANVELLEGLNQTDPRAQARLDAVARGTGRLARVVDGLLALAQAGDPDMPLADSTVDLATLIEEAADLRRIDSLRSGVSIRVELPDEPVHVQGDALSLDMVVANLVSNGVKYSPHGGTVTVALVHEADRAILTCTDEGIGMSHEDQARVFDEFFRSSDTLARAQQGTGLGLSIVDRVVRRHGGTIDVSSALGRGSTFRVELPTAIALGATA